MVSSHPSIPHLTGCDRLVRFWVSTRPLVAQALDEKYLAVLPGIALNRAADCLQGDLVELSQVKRRVNLMIWMSTPVYVDPESSTQADGAQSSRVPVPLPEDLYEAIRQAYLVGMDTASEPFEDPESETLESPHIVASPVSLPDSTSPVCHVKELEGSDTSGLHVWQCVQPVLSPSYSARIAEAAAVSDVSFRKRFRSSYESSPSPTVPVRKRYRGTSEFILGTDIERDELKDEEVEDSSDSDSGSEDAEDEGLTAGVKGPCMDDEVYGLDDESHGSDDESCGIDDEGYRVESDGLGLEEEEEAVPGG
ncbi:hypothetical protein Tco_0298993, partial [Tanacetum coccineum]